VNLTRSRYNFDIRTAFVQQRGRFQRALTGSDHEDLFSTKLSEFAMFACV
jgi:hypothetical protein